MFLYLKGIIQGIPALLTPTFLPPSEHYSLKTFRGDVLAGITVAVVQVPQSMAFALVAGLPAVYGLYASLAGCIASIWGSSRHLSAGPLAMMSLLTLTSVAPFAEPGSDAYVHLVAQLTLMVGLVYLIMGIFRLGWVMQFIPSSVIVGFSIAGGILVIMGQVPILLGVSAPQHDLAILNVLEIFLSIFRASLPTLVVSGIALGLLYTFKKLPREIPGSLLLIVIGSLVGYFLNFEALSIPLLHIQASGLPQFSVPWFDVRTFSTLLLDAVIIAIAGYVSTLVTAKTLSKTTRERLETDQELFGHGLANTTAAFFQGLPIAGSLMRTIMNIETGGKTPVSSIVASIATILVLIFLMPVFYFLPKFVLAVIVVFSILPVINIGRLGEMYRISRTDGTVAILTFTLAFFLKADLVILTGVIAALALFIRQTVFGARVTEVAIDPRLNILRAVSRHPEVLPLPGVVIARVSMSMYYANTANIVSALSRIVDSYTDLHGKNPTALVLDVSSVNIIDITGIEILQDFFERLVERNIEIGFIYARKTFREPLKQSPGFPAFAMYHNIADMRSAFEKTNLSASNRPDLVQ